MQDINEISSDLQREIKISRFQDFKISELVQDIDEISSDVAVDAAIDYPIRVRLRVRVRVF